MPNLALLMIAIIALAGNIQALVSGQFGAAVFFSAAIVVALFIHPRPKKRRK
jgi:hypothetical protein